MKLRPILMYAVAGALALPAAATTAVAGTSVPSRIALDDAPTSSVLVIAMPGEYHAISWGPRRWGRTPERDHWSSRDNANGPVSTGQIHAGFFDPDGDSRTSFLAGVRGGIGPDQHVQFGLGADWAHKSERATELVSRTPLPGGGSSERRIELARSSTNLFPLQAYAQFMPGDPGALMPYFGVSGGYQVLLLSADDFQTGDKFDATYGGWGWQAFAGVSVPVSGKSRLNAEVFRNQSTVERDVTDPQSGITYREEIPLDGIGMRFGVGWGF